MSVLKGDLINAAYSRIRVSGLTHLATPADVALALDRLEDLMATWEDVGICLGYIFEDTPDPNSRHNIPRKYQTAVKSNLAIAVLSDFGKIPAPTLVAEAQGSFSMLMGQTAKVPTVSYPSRMPIGAGNRRYRSNRFFSPAEASPTSCLTRSLLVGEIVDYAESFKEYLEATETVSSYTLTSDNDSLEIVSSSLATPVISYRVEAKSTGAVIKCIISIKTSLGREKIRVIYFDTSEVA